MYYIYILYSRTANRYYVGHSINPWARLAQHLSNSGDKYTGSYKDWELMGVFEVSTIRADADRIEKLIKRQKSRVFIERMLDPNFKGVGPFANLIRLQHVLA